MSTKPFTSLRRIAGHALTIMLFCASFSGAAEAQATPAVSASYAIGLSHPTGLGTLPQGALDTFGDWVVADLSKGGIYELPAGSTTMITLAPAGSLSTKNPGIAIDSNNNLYLEANYNNCILMFPYDPTTKTWDGLSTLSPANTTENTCPNSGGGTSPYIFAQYGITVSSASGKWQGYFQPWGIAVDKNNNLVIGAQNSTPFIFTLSVVGSGASAKPGPGQLIVDKMTKRPVSVAEDQAGNIYFVEDSGGLPGVLEVPAGMTDLASDADPSIVRVDPNLPSVVGVTTDSAGNLYISDSTDGVFFVPNSTGTPNTAAAVMLTPIPAQGEALPDLTRDVLYVPTTQTQSNGQADVAEVMFSSAMLGSTAVGTPAASSSAISFSFNSSVTPNSFVIEEAGAASPDFTIASGGTCTAATAYAAQSGCTVNVTLNPHTAGDVSAKLDMLDTSGNVLGSMTLQGTGIGSALQVQPSQETAIGSGLKTPTQVAVDAGHNIYVADSGLGQVVEYPNGASASTSVGTGLTAPTGVATDGAGDLFIADSGSVLEVPNGPNGLNAAGQFTLKSGLGSNLRLAADGLNDVYISDPDNHQIVKISNPGGSVGPLAQMETDLTGFNTPSALAVDSSNDLFVADGSNLIEVTPSGTQSTLLTTLSGVTGLAVDASGSVYVTSSGGTTVRIPNESGTLNPSDQMVLAAHVTNPTSIAIDSAENLYITDATAEDVDVESANAYFDFGTLATASATASQDFTILNAGNSPLNITGFTGTADFSETATSCSGPVAPGTSCSATITFSPGPGDQGSLQGEVVITSDAANSPIGVNGVGVGAALAASTTTATAGAATVDGVPVKVTVAPTSGTTPTPTGQVTLTLSGNGITPVTLSGTLSGGTVTLTPTQLPVGTYQIAVSYSGDRVYSSSSTSISVAVGPGAVSVVQPTMDQVLKDHPEYPYVLSASGNQYEPYDGSQNTWNYTYTLQVVATDGAPLIGQPVYDTHGKLVGMNYGSVTFQGAPYNAAAGSGCAPEPVNSDGTVPFDTTCLTITATNTSIPDIMNSYTITPVYSPDGTGTTDAGYTNPNYTSATGTAISFTAVSNPMVQISSNPSSVNVAAGSSATATLTVSSLLGYGHAGINGLEHNYSLPVQLQCDGLPAYATCTFTYPNPAASDPNSVSVGPAPGTTLIDGTVCNQAQGCVGPGTVMLTITTNIPSGVASLQRGTSETLFATMFGAGLLSLVFGRRKSLRKRLMTLACVAVCCGILTGISGCSSTQLGGNHGSPTPAGTYNVLVTAKEVGSGPVNPGPPYVTYGSDNQVSLPFTIQVKVQ